ncbi:MAG: rRNA maturation RNase YbeY [Methylococcaceae bacterium]|nr:rRNA maturation RNase YbeY [Methylococcaceae bacterium]
MNKNTLNSKLDPMTHLLDIQLASDADNIPSAALFQQWLNTALSELSVSVEVLIRIVDEPEMTELNQTYRHKTGATNILSFPFEAPAGVDLNLLGDLVVCAPVLEREALAQNKSLEQHWAHIVIHGLFHLLGYDHNNEIEAEAMEALEVKALKKLHINNPYEER